MLCRWHIASKTLKLTKSQYSCFILAYFFIYNHQTVIKERTWMHFHQFDWENVALFFKKKKKHFYDTVYVVELEILFEQNYVQTMGGQNQNHVHLK